MVLMAQTLGSRAKSKAEGKVESKIDYRKVRRNSINDTHPIYKTRIKKVLQYMATVKDLEKYRSIQDIRSATGVSYIFILSLIRLKLLSLADPKDVALSIDSGNARKYVTLTVAGLEVYELLLKIDMFNVAD